MAVDSEIALHEKVQDSNVIDSILDDGFSDVLNLVVLA